MIKGNLHLEEMKSCSIESIKFLSSLRAEDVVELAREDLLPEDSPLSLRAHYRHASQFLRLRGFLLSEMSASGDATLASDNQNILQTVCQTVDLETAEIRKVLSRLRSEGECVAAFLEGEGGAGAGADPLPRGFVCPLTLTLMREPVIAADGHSYEKAQLEEWLRDNDTSPLTNLRLPHKLAVPNHALRSLIEEYRQRAFTAPHRNPPTPAAPTSASTVQTSPRITSLPLPPPLLQLPPQSHKLSSPSIGECPVPPGELLCKTKIATFGGEEDEVGEKPASPASPHASGGFGWAEPTASAPAAEGPRSSCSIC